MVRWVWSALDGDGRLSSGEQVADEPQVVRAVLQSRGLDAVLILPPERWAGDLAGGPPGVPPPVRSAAEIALLRADGDLELPPMRGEPRMQPNGSDRRHGFHLHRPGPGHHAPPPASVLAVRVRPWSHTLVSVAIRAPGGEVLSGTERLYGTDDDGLAAAAEWKGQLGFVLEGWLLDCAPDGSIAPSREDEADVDEIDAPDAEQAARWLDG